MNLLVLTAAAQFVESSSLGNKAGLLQVEQWLF